jgi:hypothetical protein
MFRHLDDPDGLLPGSGFCFLSLSSCLWPAWLVARVDLLLSDEYRHSEVAAVVFLVLASYCS